MALSLEGAEYEPEQCPDLVRHLDDPKMVPLPFDSGKLVCPGAKRSNHVDKAVEDIYRITCRELSK
ncbi:MAG: hypothetical protein WCK39_01105 [Methanomassiliicoccales archaeon]